MKNYFVLITLFFISQISSANVEIVLKPKVEISGKVIRLGDVAEISANNDLKIKLSQIEIGKTNPNGRDRIITAPHIKSCLRRDGLEIDQITFDGKTSAVSEKILIITSEKIYDSARIFFRENLNLNDPRASFEIEPTQPIQPIEIPDENAKLNLRSIGEIGRGMIEAQIIFNNQTVKKTPISFNVLVKRPIVVAAKEIQRNSKIHNTQLKIEHRTIRNPIRKPITEIADAIGRISKMKIREGEIITSSHLQKEFIVSRKASILLIAQKGSLKIQAKGIALENGELGQMIRVINANSKKELIGEVIGEKLIRIEF